MQCRYQTKRTMKLGIMVIHMVFDQAEGGAWRVRAACCQRCQAGRLTGFCHHIVVGMEGLNEIQLGLIDAGECNHGHMHWGLKQSNDQRAKVPTLVLAVLAGEECKATYSIRHGRRRRIRLARR